MSSPRNWREIPQRYRMEALKCQECGKICFPPRLICPKCHSREFESIRLSDEGTIYTYTVIRVPPSQFKDESPYAVAVVELEDGARITAQVADCAFEELEIGKRVRIEFRKIQEDGEAGILCYGYKCIPVQ
jgi:uncharacterized OB-fold protein